MNGKAALVFLHGWASGPEVWAGQEKYFSSHRVIKFNYHQGVRDAVAGDGISPYAEAVLTVINRETDEPVILIGWSLGAMVALELAALMSRETAGATRREIAGPANYPKIAGLALVGGAARFTRTAGYDGGLPEAVVKRMKKKLTGYPGQTLEEFYSLLFTPEERKAGVFEQFQKEMLSRAGAWSEEELAAGLDYLLRKDLREHLNTVDVPCLIVHGERDEICPWAAGRYLHENLMGSRAELIPGCGHMPLFSRAEIFNKGLKRWIDNLD